MNYNQCLECLELNRENAELSDGQLAMLRSKLQIQTVEDKKVIRLKKDAALQMSYLEKGFKYAGIKCMVYDTKALGDYRNRWRIGGKMISQKMLCEAVEQIQAHGEQMPGMLQTEGLITEFLFAQSDAKVLLLEGRDECDKPVSYKVKKKNLKRQVADIENYKDVHLGTLGRDAIVGAYRVLEMLPELKMQGFDIEQGYLWKAFEETYVTPDFGLINSKPLMFTDEVLSGAQAHELAENITEYLPERPLLLILGATKETQIRNVLGALAEGKITRPEIEVCVKRFLEMVMKLD